MAIENHGKMAKITAEICENREIYDKITESTVKPEHGSSGVKGFRRPGRSNELMKSPPQKKKKTIKLS